MMKNYNLLEQDGIWVALVIIVTLIAGSSFVMWMGEQVTEFGIGNGISIILFAGILSRVPSMVFAMSISLKSGTMQWWHALLVVIGILALIVLITWVNGAERRIPVQYAKQVKGRKMYGGQNTHMPIKVNMSGVMPVIFASSILSLPPTIQMFLGNRIKEGSGWAKFFGVFSSTHWAYAIIYFVFIIAFAYFYSSIQYNPIEMSKNIRDNGGSIPGIRPGEPTSRYIGKIIGRITLLGALLLSVVALFPDNLLPDLHLRAHQGRIRRRLERISRRYFDHNYGRCCS